MAEPNLYDVYKLLGELTSGVKALDEKVDDLKGDIQTSEVTASSYRKGMRAELQKIVLRLTQAESDIHSVKTKVDEMKNITDDVKTLTTQAEGAGMAGRYLLKIGIGLFTAIGWIMAAFAWFQEPPGN